MSNEQRGMSAPPELKENMNFYGTLFIVLCIVLCLIIALFYYYGPIVIIFLILGITLFLSLWAVDKAFKDNLENSSQKSNNINLVNNANSAFHETKEDDSSKRENLSDINVKENGLGDKIGEKNVLEELKTASFEDIKNKIYNEIIERINNNTVLIQNNKEISTGIDIHSIKEDKVFKKISTITNHAERHIKDLKINLRINLNIGILTTIIAIFVLTYALLNTDNDSDWSLFLIKFAPKITFVIFVQLFSFFFLRLYKNNLEDIKYFQNELININAKSSSLEIALIINATDLMKEILKDISQTERNFKMGKEETTLWLERLKIEKDIDKDLIMTLRKILSDANPLKNNTKTSSDSSNE